MKISAKAEYACVAMLTLALRAGNNEPIRLAEIAGPNDIPDRFLVQILLQLKGAGFVQSLRGAAGGYKLLVEPSDITLWDVVHTIDGPTTSSTGEAGSRNGVGWNILSKVWEEANRREKELLQQTSFEQLVETAWQQNANMYYI